MKKDPVLQLKARYHANYMDEKFNVLFRKGAV